MNPEGDAEIPEALGAGPVGPQGPCWAAVGGGGLATRAELLLQRTAAWPRGQAGRWGAGEGRVGAAAWLILFISLPFRADFRLNLGNCSTQHHFFSSFKEGKKHRRITVGRGNALRPHSCSLQARMVLKVALTLSPGRTCPCSLLGLLRSPRPQIAR